MTSTAPALFAAALAILVGRRARPWIARRPAPTLGASPARIRSDRNRARWRHRRPRLTRVARRERACAPMAVADWCDTVASRVRTGASLRDALAAVPDDPATSAATSRLRHALERGAPAAEAVETARDAGGPHLTLACQVIGVAARLGGAPSTAIERTAVVLRQRAADADERVAQAAQARMSAHVLTALPVAVLGILAGSDPDVRTALAAPVGATAVATGLVLNVVGWWWMHRLVGQRPQATTRPRRPA